MRIQDYMKNLTPEEKRAHVAKSQAGKLQKKLRKEEKNRELRELQEKIESLKLELDSMRSEVKLQHKAKSLTREYLLSEDEIVNQRYTWCNNTGIYFLIKHAEVVYVGQSKNIFSRISNHATTKDFDCFSWISCPEKNLDKLESLYIHLLKPALNGDMNNGLKNAPISLIDIIGK